MDQTAFGQKARSKNEGLLVGSGPDNRPISTVLHMMSVDYFVLHVIVEELSAAIRS